jgi:hypothetical protein
MYRGQFLRTIGLGPGLVLDNLTLECRETFVGAVICPKGACKRGKVVNSHWNRTKNRGIYETSLIVWSDLEVTQFVLGSENIARRSDLSVTRPTRALKEPDKMNKTVVEATMGAVLSNMPINGCFCRTKKL